MLSRPTKTCCRLLLLGLVWPGLVAADWRHDLLKERGIATTKAGLQALVEKGLENA